MSETNEELRVLTEHLIAAGAPPGALIRFGQLCRAESRADALDEAERAIINGCTGQPGLANMFAGYVRDLRKP